MDSKAIRTTLIAAATSIQQTAIAADQPIGLVKFVERKWKVPDFQIPRDVVVSTVSMRVST